MATFLEDTKKNRRLITQENPTSISCVYFQGSAEKMESLLSKHLPSDNVKILRITDRDFVKYAIFSQYSDDELQKRFQAIDEILWQQTTKVIERFVVAGYNHSTQDDINPILDIIENTIQEDERKHKQNCNTNQAVDALIVVGIFGRS
jgi:hypothetical protein